MAKITFLGTGLIGAGLAEAALGRGDTVTVWNRTVEKAQALASHGATVAATAAEAVTGAERIHVALSEDAAVDAVLAGCRDAVGDAVVVDHTTASPAGTKARAERLAGAGVAYLHAPVFMSPRMCREAKGIILAAGPKAVYDRVGAALDAMTGSVLYLGERPDLAAANKLFGNALLITITAGLSDVFTMARALDLEPEAALSLFSKFNPAGVIAGRGTNMIAGDYAASFELTMARKDVRLMVESAGDRQGELAVLPSIARRMDELIERGFGADDLGVLSVDAIPKKRPGG